jgi:tetratricopeptide (TPR) repeat protein
MAVFAAPARLEVVAHTSGVDEVEALDALTRLVDASLVVFGEAPAARYGMLEPIRQYAAERLGSRTEEVEDRLIDWYRLEVGDRLRFPGEVAGLRRDTENLFRALEYCVRRRAWGWWLDIVFPVVHLLSRNLSGFEAITSTAARIPDADLSGRDRARLSVARTLSSEAFSVRSWLATAELARAGGDPELECFTLLGLTNAYLSENRVEEAQTILEEAARFPITAPVHRHYIHALTAAVAADSGSGEHAGEAYQSAVADAREIGDPEMLGVRLLEHAYLLVSWGQTTAALEAITEAQGLIKGDAHDRYDVAMTAALVNLMVDDPRAGARDALEALHISPTLPPRGRRFPVSLLSLTAAALLAALRRDAEAVTLAAFADRTIERATELADRRVIERLHQHAAGAHERLEPCERRSADAAGAAMQDRDAVVYAIDQIALALHEPATTR